MQMDCLCLPLCVFFTLRRFRLRQLGRAAKGWRVVMVVAMILQRRRDGLWLGSLQEKGGCQCLTIGRREEVGQMVGSRRVLYSNERLERGFPGYGSVVKCGKFQKSSEQKEEVIEGLCHLKRCSWRRWKR